MMTMHRVQAGELRRLVAAGALLCLALAACSGEASSVGGGVTGPAPPGDRVLFVGNSLTEANELPLMVEALSATGGTPLSVESVTYGGVALEDHWALGTQRTVERGGWRFVVLQQGPSALPESRANLRDWVKRFDAVIRRAGATTALFMVWPDSRRDSDFPRVSESYRLAALDVGGILLPAGDAWRAAWRRDASLPLYGPDGFHPSVPGSYLAALTILGGLTESSPVGLPHRLWLRSGTLVEVPAATAQVLQAAADEALSGR